MPVVPRYEASVAPAGGMSARFDAPAMPDPTAQASLERGQALQQVSGVAGRVALDVAQQADELRITDALNQAKERALRITHDPSEGFMALKGRAALERPNGKALADEVVGGFDKYASELAGTLGNDRQRQVFSQQVQGMSLGLRERAMQHESGEFKTYSLSVAEGVQATALRDIGLNWRNPDAVHAAVMRIEAETYRQAQLLGKSAEWQVAHARKLTSNAHKTAMLAALEASNPDVAEAYLVKHSKGMEADDIMQVRGHITKEMDARVGFTAGRDAVLAVQPRLHQTDAARAFNILLGTESGNRQFGKDGKPLTSSAGAIGIAQVMPGTGPEAAKLAGVKWDESRYRSDAEYNKNLGRAYFEEQLRQQGGDLAKAFAAYNAGPGRLKEATMRAAARAGGDWLTFMPAETQAYVAKNMREFETGAGRQAQPTKADIDAQLVADPRLAGNPQRLKVARDEAHRMFDGQVQAVKQREDDLVAEAMRQVIANGGRFNDLSPMLRSSLPPGKVDDLLQFSQRITKGEDNSSPLLYAKLASEPDMLKGMTDAQFFALRSELSESDHKHFANVRGKLRNPEAGASNGPGDLPTGAIKTTLDSRLRVLGIDPTPKDRETTEVARVGAIRMFVDRSLLAAQRDAGKKFSDAEVAAHVDGLLARNAEFRGWFNKGAPLLTMKPGEVPSDARKAIEAAYRKKGNENPGEAQVLEAYWMSQFTRAR